MIDPELERARPAQGEGFSDSVSFSFADPDAQLYGLARIGLSPGEGRSSALAVLFAGRDVAAAVTEADAAAEGTDWERVAVGPVATGIEQPLERWAVSVQAAEGGFNLRASALSSPLELGGDTAAGRASGLNGYEQLCRVEGTVTVGGERRQVDCLGQRGHGWGPAAWERISLARTVSAWLDGPRAVMLSAVRPVQAGAHGDEALSAFLVEPGPDGPVERSVGEPRLSTTYDGDGRQRRAGLELWLDEDDGLPRRLAGEVACGTSLELGRLRLDCAFFEWRMEGRSGVGRYDVVRRA